MRLWRPTSEGGWQRPDLQRIQDLVARSFDRRGEQPPRVVAISAADHAYDDHLYETFLELAPGVVASATWDLAEEEKEERHLVLWDWSGCDAVSVASAAADVARHYLALGPDHLADLLHDLRLRIRRRLASLSTVGGGGRLLSLRLTGGDWLYSDEFKLVLRLTRLDKFLFPDVEEILIEDLDALDDELDHWGRDVARGYGLRHALAAEGATGTIDLLTLNAILQLGDLRSTLRALGRGIMPWASNAMELFGEDGNLWSYGTDRFTGLIWRRHSITHHTVLPDTVLDAVAGRPVTDLITHPMLSPDMTIVAATRTPKTGGVQLQIDQPRRLFCHHSGRAWEDPRPSGMPYTDHTITHTKEDGK